MKKIRLFLSVFILLISCEKQESATATSEKLNLQTNYNQKTFEDRLPINHTIHWNETKTDFYDELETKIFEIPISYSLKNSSQKRNFLIFKLIAVPKINSPKTYNFYLVKFLHSAKTPTEISLFNLEKYSGILNIINSEDKKILSKFYSNGILTGDLHAINYPENYLKKPQNKKWMDPTVLL